MGFLDKLTKVAKDFLDELNVGTPAKEEVEKEEKVELEYMLSADFEVTELGDGTVELSSYIGFDCDNLLVAAEIDGKKVKGIGKIFPEGSPTIKNIKFSEGIEYIADEAFKGCEGIENIVLPESMKKLGEAAFANSSLVSIYIPEGVETIARACFEGCVELQKVNLPNNLEVIEENTFNGCVHAKLENIPEKLRIVKTRGFCECGSYNDFNRKDKVPAMLERLEDYAFYHCDAFYGVAGGKLYLPSTLTHIGEYAMCGWAFDIEQFYIPASVKYIGENAFNECYAEEVFFEKGITCDLLTGLLANSPYLKAVHIPGSVTTVDKIFYGKLKQTGSRTVYDEYGRPVYDEFGDKITKYVEYDEWYELPEDFVLYCEANSAAMKFARENGIVCKPGEF